VSTTIDTERVICALDDLAEHPCRAFTIGDGPWPLSGFVVRKGDTVHAYHNHCPHAGHPLNLKPHEFLTPDRSMIVCCSHGAVFEPATGYCVIGPCAGQSLRPVPVSVESGYVLLAEGADPAAFAPA
jgi:nitrite reductase/ring-hydroxylating ferredoxin subunit